MGSIRGVPRGKYAKKIAIPIRVYCWKCNKSYKRKSVLELHIMTKHLKYRVRCPFCGKELSSASVCRRHLRINHNIKSLKELDLKYERGGASISTSAVERNSNFLHKLSSGGHQSFPHMANVLSFKHNNKFGCHIVANCDIDVGKVVVAAPAFAQLEIHSSFEERCYHCGKTRNIRFFACPHCINTWFCSKRCSLNKIHASKCEKIFNREDPYTVRLATQMIKVGLQKSNVHFKAFMDYCCGVLFIEKGSRQCIQPFSNYGEIMQLMTLEKESNIKDAHRVVECLSKLPEFYSHLDNKSFDFRRILLHLALTHIGTIPLNSFSVDEYSKRDNRVRCVVSIFDFVSRINHSCTPNLDSILDANGIMYCIARHSIKNGEQVFIDYLGGQQYSSVDERKNDIKKIWKFNCDCSICQQAH